jgi:hypothetical protein
MTLANIVIWFSSLSAGSLGRLLHITKQDVDQTLEDLHAILNIPKNQTNPVRLHHPSFRDFLLDNNRCKDMNFQVDEKQAHKTLAARCIQLMSESLKQDICGLDAPGALIADIDSSRVERSLPPELHRLEALGWMQKVSEGIHAIASLEAIAAVSQLPA